MFHFAEVVSLAPIGFNKISLLQTTQAAQRTPSRQSRTTQCSCLYIYAPTLFIRAPKQLCLEQSGKTDINIVS